MRGSFLKIENCDDNAYLQRIQFIGFLLLSEGRESADKHTPGVREYYSLVELLTVSLQN